MGIEELPLETLTPSQLWAGLDPETRTLAAQALYTDRDARREGDVAIAAQLRYREVAVRKLPIEQRIKHVLRIPTDDSLASSLLLALHLKHRKPLLTAFLDELGIPHDDGMISEDHDVEPLTVEKLTPAVERLFREFPDDQARLYLTALYALDPVSWEGLAALLTPAR